MTLPSTLNQSIFTSVAGARPQGRRKFDCMVHVRIRNGLRLFATDHRWHRWYPRSLVTLVSPRFRCLRWQSSEALPDLERLAQKGTDAVVGPAAEHQRSDLLHVGVAVLP